MHFVIYVFIAVMCFVTGVLFSEVFTKWAKLALAVIGSVAGGFAASILIRKIAELTSAFAKPQLFTTGLIASVVVFVVVLVVRNTLIKKK